MIIFLFYFSVSMDFSQIGGLSFSPRKEVSEGRMRGAFILRFLPHPPLSAPDYGHK